MFSFQGKVPRAIFWFTSVVNLFAVLIIVGANIALYKGMEGIPAVDPNMLRVILLVSLIPLVPAVWVLFAVTVKRFHDRNKSGYWALLALTGIGILWIIIECGFLKSMDASEKTTATEPAPINTPPSPIVPVQSEPVIQTPVETKVEVKQEETVAVEKDTTPFPSPAVVSHVEEKPIVQETKVTPIPQISVMPQSPNSSSVQPEIKIETKTEIPTPKQPEGGVQKTEPVAPAQGGAPYTIPPVRPMSEMLAELERLSKQTSGLKKEIPIVKPVAVPSVTNTTVATPKPSEPVPMATKVATNQEPPAINTTVLEDTPSPKTTDDLTNALNNIMAEAESGNQTETTEETVTEPVIPKAQTETAL